MQEASYYSKIGNQSVECLLCPFKCKIQEGKRGNCRARINIDGILYAENYGYVCSLASDPIEKKPLYHFFPGKSILSIGNIGCNLHCEFCQNWQISQTNKTEFGAMREHTPLSISMYAQQAEDNIGVAFTYNEPTVWYEYMIDIAKEVKDNGQYNAMVSNGYINEKPLLGLLPYIDAFNIDLKAFNDEFYKNYTKASIGPVKKNLKTIKKHNKHLEITNLVITRLNDNEKEFGQMIDWISSELGKETVLHISRYFPNYQSNIPPTPVATLDRFHQLANEKLDYVYLGNVISTHQANTFCPRCGQLIIERHSYHTKFEALSADGRCEKCGFEIINNNYYENS